jgi:hypothetical protein
MNRWTVKDLDPAGMDALESAWVDGAGLLVLGKKWEEGSDPGELIRPGTVIFFPDPGVYSVRAGYDQALWNGFFEPAEELHLTSEPVRLFVP